MRYGVTVSEEEVAAAMGRFSPEARESARMLIAGEVPPLPPIEWLRYLSAHASNRDIADHTLMTSAYLAAGGRDRLTELAQTARANRNDPTIAPALEMYKAYFLGPKPTPPEFAAINEAALRIIDDLKRLSGL